MELTAPPGPASLFEDRPCPFDPTLGSVDLARLVDQALGGRCPPWPRGLPQEQLAELSILEPAALAERLGLSIAGARRLAAGFELGRRVERARVGPRPPLDTPARVHAVLAPLLRGRRRESFWSLLLDGRHRLLKLERISEGTLTTSLVHPREVFAPALLAPAAALIVAHNHPSGDPTPSDQDREVTRRLAAAGELLGVPLLDHLVVADGGFVSLRERFGLS